MTQADLDSIVGWLRAVAQRLARENRADLGRVSGQLRIINRTAREILARKAARTRA